MVIGRFVDFRQVGPAVVADGEKIERRGGGFGSPSVGFDWIGLDWIEVERIDLLESAWDAG